MKTHIPVASVSIEAAADLTKQHFVGFDGDVCGADEKALGVAELDTDSGEQASVIFAGIALVEAGGNISAGDPVVSNAAGEALAATAFSVSVPVGATPVTSTGAQPNLTEAGGYLPQAVNGYALDAGVDGDIIRVMLV